MFYSWKKCAATTLLGCLLAGPAMADAPGSLQVEVIQADNDKPIPGAVVRIQDKAGKGPLTELKTDEKGTISVPELEEGDYYVEIKHPSYAGDRTLFKLAAGKENKYRTLLDAAGKERVIKVKEDRLVTENPLDGALVRRDRKFIQQQLGENSVQSILATVPGTNRNSMGQTHVRGDHKSVSFAVDGVAVPITTTSSTSNPLDPDFFDSFDFKTGSYDATQGGQVGLLFNAQTDWSKKEPFFELRPSIGNLGQGSIMAKVGGGTEDGNFNYFLGAKTGATDLQFDPPSPTSQTTNNRGANASVMARFKARLGGEDLGLTLAHQNYSFQVPQIQADFDAGVRQYQGDQNTLIMGSWKHEIDEKSDLLMALTYLKTRQTYDHNFAFTPYNAADPNVTPDLADAGLPANPANPGAPYLPTSRVDIQQVQPSARYTLRLSDRETIKAGLEANFIRSRQVVNFMDPGGGGGLPGGAPTFDADIARSGFLGGIYFTHTLPLADTLTLNYGLRLDRFDNGVGLETGQISPSINLGWTPSQNDALRVSYNRLFQAPPLELDVSAQTNVNPQRVNLFEISYERHLGSGVTAKAAYVYKQYRDQIDIGQLVPGSNVPIFAPVNFARARYSGFELSLNTRNKTGLNGFLTTTISTAKPTELGLFTGTELPQYNDHDQRVQVAAGVSHTWENGFTAATDVYYGSGFPQESFASYQAAGINPYGYSGERVPRFITNVNLSYFPPTDSDGIQAGASLQIQNLFDQRTLLNFYSEFSGTRFVQQRRFLISGIFRF